MEEGLIDRLLETLWLDRRLNQNTLNGYRRDLEKIARRLSQSGRTLKDADEADLAAAVYVDGEQRSSQARALSACKRLYIWMEREDIRTDNPTRLLKPPKIDKNIPTLITEQQISRLLATPDTDTPHGLRDKALLELMYATGLRVSEAVGLNFGNVDLDRGCITALGKGDKQRMVDGAGVGVLGGTLLYGGTPTSAERQELRRIVCQSEKDGHFSSVGMDDCQRICR